MLVTHDGLMQDDLDVVEVAITWHKEQLYWYVLRAETWFCHYRRWPEFYKRIGSFLLGSSYEIWTKLQNEWRGIQTSAWRLEVTKQKCLKKSLFLTLWIRIINGWNDDWFWCLITYFKLPLQTDKQMHRRTMLTLELLCDWKNVFVLLKVFNEWVKMF